MALPQNTGERACRYVTRARRTAPAACAVRGHNDVTDVVRSITIVPSTIFLTVADIILHRHARQAYTGQAGRRRRPPATRQRAVVLMASHRLTTIPVLISTDDLNWEDTPLPYFRTQVHEDLPPRLARKSLKHRQSDPTHGATGSPTDIMEVRLSPDAQLSGAEAGARSCTLMSRSRWNPSRCFERLNRPPRAATCDPPSACGGWGHRCPELNY